MKALLTSLGLVLLFGVGASDGETVPCPGCSMTRNPPSPGTNPSIPLTFEFGRSPSNILIERGGCERQVAHIPKDGGFVGACDQVDPCKMKGKLVVKNSSSFRTFVIECQFVGLRGTVLGPGASQEIEFGNPDDPDDWKAVPCGTVVEVVATMPGPDETTVKKVYSWTCAECEKPKPQ